MSTAVIERNAAWLLTALLGLPGPALAEVTARLTIGSAYLERGLEQSQSSPIYQGSFEYQTGGWFAGVWASRVDFGDYDGRSVEVDYYLGYGRRLRPGVAVEVTALRYTFLGNDARANDWNELQLSAYLADRWTVTWGVAHNWWASGESTQFVEGTFRYALPAAITLDATLGYQLAQQAAGVEYGYAETGLARRLDNFVVRVGYAAVDGDARDRFPGFARNHWVASITWQP